MRKIGVLCMFLLLGAACTVIATDAPTRPSPEVSLAEEAITTEESVIPNSIESTTEDLPAAKNRRVLDTNIYSFSQLIPFDGIRPVYEPIFATIAETEGLLFDEELILGIALQGEAKAYPISVLRFREMVNDELGGIPTLVTW